ncbi:MAG: pyridoxal-phosphate dependent enzyme [bacterium]|nr:pyridoxal-phosphate dependent enzyme [bacterium]
MNARPSGWGGNPMAQASVADIQKAAKRIAPHIIRTPLVPLHSYQAPTGILLKPEILQPIGSFKLRGVLNWALSLPQAERAKGLATTSAGNTAQALGYAARLLGVTARTLVPETILPNKLEAITAYGVEPIKLPFPDLLAYMLEEQWREEPYAYLNPWGDPHLISGHGTLGLEVLHDLPDVQSIFVPVGGGGLIAGVGSAVRGAAHAARIIAVQSENCPALKASFDRGHGGWIDARPSFCDGTAVPLIVDEMYPLLRAVIDEVVTVTEASVAQAVRRLALRNKLVTEGSGAIALAAALATPASKRGVSACVLSGGSIDADRLAQFLRDDA